MKQHTSISSKKRILSTSIITLTLVALGIVLIYGFSILQSKAPDDDGERQKEANKIVETPPKEQTQTEIRKNPLVVLETSMGTIRLELNYEKAPRTVENFLHYVDSGYYTGTVFHRVIPDFMIQGGGMNENLEELQTSPPIRNEANNGLSNKRGTIAMARTAFVHSATSQFFINVADNPYLDYRDNTAAGYGYCVFGRVISGMDTVDKIVNVPTHTVEPHSDVPVESIVIEDARRVETQNPE